MAKNTPPTGNPAVDPFRDAPRFNPFGPSPLSGNAARQSSARGVNVQSAPENDRARGIPSDIDAGRQAPRFGDPVRTQPPFPAAGDSAAQPTVPPQRAGRAGGSK